MSNEIVARVAIALVFLKSLVISGPFSDDKLSQKYRRAISSDESPTLIIGITVDGLR